MPVDELKEKGEERSEEKPELAIDDTEYETDALPEWEDTTDKSSALRAWLVTAAVVGILAAAGMGLMLIRSSSGDGNAAADETSKAADEPGDAGKLVRLNSEALTAAGIEIESVTHRPAMNKLLVSGAVELNPETTEMATALVGGRIEKVYYGVGDRVRKGAVLAIISSPQLAQMHGRMHEARTRYELAQRNLARVQRSENRVAVLQAKARLDEATSTLNRTRRLIELGAGAGKDLVAAETAYKTAKAEYEFQTNIALNKELQEAKAEVETSRVDLKHIQDELRALGVTVNSTGADDHSKNTSLVAVRSPLSGIVTERRFNAGAGIEPAVPIFSISNLDTVYVIANVPEANLGGLQVGSPAEITAPVAGTFSGRVSYIDPRLDETTRTAKVRLEVNNPKAMLRAGMFVEVDFFYKSVQASFYETVVPSAAVQRSGDKTIVFVPREGELGAFEVREVEAGPDLNGFTKVISGLNPGEKVVTKGSFALKTQLEKASLGDE